MATTGRPVATFASGQSVDGRYFFFRTLTTSRTAAADALNACFSSADSLSLTISSIAAGAELHGTPM